MTQEEFQALTKRLEAESAGNPFRYRVRVFGLAMLGYGYIIAVVALLFAGLLALGLLLVHGGGHSGAVVVKLAIPLLALEALIIRALWVSLPAPTGLALTRESAGELFGCIENIRRTLKCPRVHLVLVNGEFNASMCQVPRLGAFGWYRNYLTVGIPLMLSLSPEGFLSVIAHELGHLSGAHSRFTAWVYRLRSTWSRIMQALEGRRQWGSFLFNRFLAWYVPHFNAYTFVLARAHEYEADRCAARIVGSRVTAEALIAGAVKGLFLGEAFWPSLFRRVEALPEPPERALAELSRAMEATPEPAQASAWFRKALEEATDPLDTHPSLADRLRALGEALEGAADVQALRAAQPVRENAAARFLGQSLAPLAEAIDHAWREDMREAWARRHEHARQANERLEALERAGAERALTIDEAWEQASLTLEFKSEEAAMPLLEELISRQPGHPLANYGLGRLLLERKLDRGIELIERAMREDPDAVIPGSTLLYDYLARQGRVEEAQKYDAWMRQQAELLGKAQAERSRVDERDRILPHGLPGEVVESLRSQLRKEPRIVRAFLVRKEVELFPQKPFIIVALKLAYRWFDSSQAAVNQKILDRLVETIRCPVPLCFHVYPGKRMERRLAEVPDAMLV